jgi:hypothetical protein
MSRALKPIAFGLALAPVILALAGAAQAAPKAEQPYIGGAWRLTAPKSQPLRTLDGSPPPLTAEGRALYQQAANPAADKPKGYFDVCLPPGTPQILWMDRPVLVLQTARKISFLFEYEHILRHVYMNEPLPSADDVDPTYGGSSVGRWQGDTLVIQTGDFNDKTKLDSSGLPHSDQLKITERLRLIDKGALLEDRVTIEDPKIYTKAWTTRVTFKRQGDIRLKEDICAEKLLPKNIPVLSIPR